jgi:hypothetical protein
LPAIRASNDRHSPRPKAQPYRQGAIIRLFVRAYNISFVAGGEFRPSTGVGMVSAG